MSDQPEKIGKYQIDDEMGRGSMGAVYSAHDPFSDRMVAIKVAHAQFISSGDGARFRKLFFNEAHAAGGLDHPNILKIFDADVDGELCYLVMELVEGARTLEEFTRPENLLPLRETVGIIYKVAKGLDYAHRQGVVHRDIKPSNILLTEDMDVKIADFSIAMITRADNTATQFTGFLGSPLYMSPEQIDEEPLSGTSDIFSLGGVMYKLLTGHHPFMADNLGAIHQRITKEDPIPITEYRRDLPEGMTYALKRMLKKDPTKRYGVALDLAADLAVIFEDLDHVQTEDNLRENFGRLKSLGFFKGFTDADIWCMADNLGAIHQRITKEDPIPITEYRRDLPEGMTYALKRMLKKDPTKRYGVALDLAADLAVIFEDLDHVQTEDNLRENFGRLKSLGFFKGFTDADIWELTRACSWQNYPAGTAIIREGESDQDCYILTSGVVAIEKNARHLDNLQEGDCFGEMGYLAKTERSATVTAKTDVSLIKVNASTIDRAAADTQLRFLKVFVRTLIDRLSDTTSALSTINAA